MQKITITATITPTAFDELNQALKIMLEVLKEKATEEGLEKEAAPDLAAMEDFRREMVASAEKQYLP